MVEILYIHGYEGHANGQASQRLKKALADRNIDANVYAPAVPLDNPDGMINFLRNESKGKDFVVASSMGAFYTMQLSGICKILINPAMPEDLLKINPQFDQVVLGKMKAQRDRFFSSWIDSEFRFETRIILGLEDDLATNSDLIHREYYEERIFEVPMGHIVNDAGAAKAAEIIENILLNGSDDISVPEVNCFHKPEITDEKIDMEEKTIIEAFKAKSVEEETFFITLAKDETPHHENGLPDKVVGLTCSKEDAFKAFHYYITQQSRNMRRTGNADDFHQVGLYDAKANKKIAQET